MAASSHQSRTPLRDEVTDRNLIVWFQSVRADLSYARRGKRQSLNQFGYHQLEENRRTKGAPDRIAPGAAGDNPEAVTSVMRLIDCLGFDATVAGPHATGVALEPDGSPAAVTSRAQQLSKLLSR